MAGTVVVSAAVAAFLYVAPPWQDDGSAVAAGQEPARPSAAGTSPPAPASASPKLLVSPKPSEPPGDSPGTEESVDPDSVPHSGPGTFTVAREGVTSEGGGSRYRVEVEDGIGVDPDSAAEDVAEILADPRGWSKGKSRTFRQVGDGSAGLVIRIGTPKTTDRLCGRYGLNTRGEVNCRGGDNVMVNLARWQLGSPTFDGPASEYRALIINHEVGHWLGHGHETCPGPGKPAPAMMQQIKGLKGCTSNAWPYDTDGRYLGGPSVP
ncbi:membrane protein [Streptomyces sp. NRRL S-4]|nr:membrane protein [Streptomyces sp. NRRL S-4]